MNFRVETGAAWAAKGEHVLAFGADSYFRFDAHGGIREEAIGQGDGQFAATARRIVEQKLPRLKAANALKSIGAAKSLDRRAFLGLLAHACNHAATQEGFASAS